jgi:hypothetical protein
MKSASLIFLALCIIPLICLAEGKPKNLIVNPSLEDDLAGRRLPAGWSPYVDTDKSYHYEAVEGGRTGKKSLMISGQGTRIHVFANGVRIDRTMRYVLRGWVRFEGDGDGWAMIKFNYRKGGENFYIPGGDRVSAGQEGWQFQTKTDRADEALEADMLWVSCKLEGNGKAYFDDLELIAYDRASLPKDFDLKHGKSNRVAAWQVLQRRIGKWDTETTVKPGKWNPEGAHTTGTETVQWALNRKFIRGEGQVNGTSEHSMHQITFDEQFNVFRMWHFSSKGHFPRTPYTGQCRHIGAFWDKRETDAPVPLQMIRSNGWGLRGC